MLNGKLRFVLGASGHIAGVINPPAKNKRSHWIGAGDALPAEPQAVARRGQGTPGQLVDRLGALAEGPCRQAGCRAEDARQRAATRPIEPAPGRYVKAKA